MGAKRGFMQQVYIGINYYLEYQKDLESDFRSVYLLFFSLALIIFIEMFVLLMFNRIQTRKYIEYIEKHLEDE